MLLPLGLVQKWETLTLVRTCVVLVNCTSFDAQYPFTRAKIFRRGIVWVKYKMLIVTEIRSHGLVVLIPTLQRCDYRKNTQGLYLNL
jgi:hypothetical protein